MKSSRDAQRRVRFALCAAVLLLFISGCFATLEGALPSWIRNIEARSDIEAVFFRLMNLPGGDVLFRRPPRETRPALAELTGKRPKDAELYALRALEDEQQLDFTAAEAHWRLSLEYSTDKAASSLALAAFFHRRSRPMDEVQALALVAGSPADAAEKLTPPRAERSWRAFEKIFEIIRAQGFAKDISIAHYRRWIARYPGEQDLYARFLGFLVSEKDYAAAAELIADYRKRFPGEQIFRVRAEAMLAYRRGSVVEGLAVYEKGFQPLWAPELIQSYLGLLSETHNLRKFLDDARAALNARPDDLNAVARVFYYYQQQGKLEAAEEAITKFRLQKEKARSSWTSQELYVCARLLEGIHSYPESARYYFALYNSKGMESAQEVAIAGIADLLLTAPETPIRFGSGELSLYRDIATMDSGPGYLNGILSLILNTTYPASEFSQQEQKAVPYFHRARAAQLLKLLDARIPNSPRRAELHARLLEYYAHAGEGEAVIAGGKLFLATFPSSPRRTEVALLMADAFARAGRAEEEFAIYDSVLREMAAKAERVPLGAAMAGGDMSTAPAERVSETPSEQEPEELTATQARSSQQAQNAAFQLSAKAAADAAGPRSPDYARVLERYLARLVQRKQIPQALGVLRREIDNNPDDPGLYERLAVFLDQNRLEAEQEETYRRAIARFPDRSWYHKLARYYLRYRKNAEFEKLTREAVDIFKGSELEEYFQSLVGGSAAMYLRLNLFAGERFPHNPVFVRNLLVAYQQVATRDPAAWEALLRRHWFEEADLRGRFFEFLSRTGRLEAEIQAVTQAVQAGSKTQWPAAVQRNPAAVQFLSQANLWRSHFEDAAPQLLALNSEYPADAELGIAASSVFRSLAYYDAANIVTAVRLEENLLAANPGSTETLARIGDIYADRELFARAAPYWERIPLAAPGQFSGYLEAATIYWDYYDFDNALRLLDAGRKKLASPSLYAYEAGALYEAKRDYPRAIQEYIKGALEAGSESPAGSRLLELARRPKHRDLAERATQGFASAAAFSSSELNLRIRVLETQNRKQELAAFLDSVVARATTMEQAAEMESLAQQKSLEAVRQRALEKQAALASDPVTRLQLRYTLARLYEQRKDLASAQRNIETLYREHPRILGVVRSTADFYWRTKQYPAAIEVLRQASKDAYPELGRQFAFEAARKSTDARLFAGARELLAPLLKDSPYDAQYLASMAETFSQADDSQGLKQFYLEKISLLRNAQFTADERKNRLALLRHGLIPALTRLSDFSGAVDQYVELINSFPDDEALLSAAALYAQKNKRTEQLVAFYAKTMQQSPRDYRWPVVLARIQSTLEDFRAAIDSYGKAITLRPDRVDLRLARAGLAERLMRFDDAVSDYERVYQLSYKDSKWMEKIAEVRARQGKTQDCIAALKAAWIDGRPEKPGNYFEVARRLESWGLLAPARAFAEQGVKAAGADLLATPENHAGATLYTRIMTRLRQFEQAHSALHGALAAASSTLPVLKEQLAREGIAAVTDQEWRARLHQSRIASAREGMRAAMAEAGSVAALFFTPEEKSALVAFAQKLWGSMTPPDREDFALPLAQSAGLAGLEADWRFELLMQGELTLDTRLRQMNTFVALQRRRLKFADLGRQLEQFAPRLRGNEQHIALLAAAEAYRAAGDNDNDLRVLSRISFPYMGSEIQQRFLSLLLARRPQQLVEMSASWVPWGQQVADFVVSHGDFALTQSVVKARGQGRPAIWSKSYNALTGLFFAEPAAQGDFLEALGNETIGERVGKQLDRKTRLAGNTWYYYGSRYGEFLGVTKLGNPEDFLAASLEQSPASTGGYVALADYYAENGNWDAAINDYLRALELAPGRPEVRERLAVAYHRQGTRAKAIAEWKRVFASLSRQLDRLPVPESFWNDFAIACDHLRTRRLFGELKPDADALLRTYLRRNGNYRSNAPLRSAFLAMGDPAAAITWILDLASVAPDPILVISDISSASWIPQAQRAPIYQRILEAKQAAASSAEGLEKEYAVEEFQSWQVRWAAYLVQTKQFARVAEYLASIPAETRLARASGLLPLDLQAAAQLKTLDARIAQYRTDPQPAPSADVLRIAVRLIFEAGDKQSARKLLEFVFAREIEEHKLAAPNFLGLAEIRIAAGDVPGALELLRRLVLVVGDTFQNLDSAAALLEKTGHHTQAIEFLEPLVKATPWQWSFQLRLARARQSSTTAADSVPGEFARIASSPEAPYGLRLQAALALRNARVTANLGSEELKLLSGAAGGSSVAAADRPYFYDARLRAAENPQTDPRTRQQLLESALSETPARDAARAPLFQAAISLRSDAYALAMMEFVLQGEMARTVGAANREEEEDIFEEIVSAEPVARDAQEETSSADLPARLSPAQQARLARIAGDALVRLDRPAEALAYFQFALQLERAAARRRELNTRIADVRSRLRRQELNRARQPILHQELEQDRTVRPRILAHVEAPARPPGKAGEKP